MGSFYFPFNALNSCILNIYTHLSCMDHRFERQCNQLDLRSTPRVQHQSFQGANVLPFHRGALVKRILCFNTSHDSSKVPTEPASGW